MAAHLWWHRRRPATAIRQTYDGGYWVAGTTSSGASGNKKSVAIGNEDIWVLRLDMQGEVLWERTYGGLRRDTTKAIQLSQEGLWLVAHSNSVALDGQAQVFFIDHKGNTKHDFFFGDSPTEPAGIALTKNGHLVVAGNEGNMENETQNINYGVMDFTLYFWTPTKSGNSE